MRGPAGFLHPLPSGWLQAREPPTDMMNELQLSSEFCALLQHELAAWPAYGSKACVEAATADYALLLARSRSIEVRTRLPKQPFKPFRPPAQRHSGCDGHEQTSPCLPDSGTPAVVPLTCSSVHALRAARAGAGG